MGMGKKEQKTNEAGKNGNWKARKIFPTKAEAKRRSSWRKEGAKKEKT